MGGGLDYNDLIFEGGIKGGSFSFKNDLIGEKEEGFFVDGGVLKINWDLEMKDREPVWGETDAKIDNDSDLGISWWKKSGEFRVILNMSPEDEALQNNRLKENNIDLWVLEGTADTESFKGEVEIPYLVKAGIEYPKIKISGNFELAGEEAESKITSGEIKTEIEEPAEGLSGEITLNNFSYKRTEELIEFGIEEGSGIEGKIKGKKIKEGKLIGKEGKPMIIGETGMKGSKNYFENAALVLHTEEEYVHWEIKGNIIEGIEKNYFVANVVNVKGEQPEGTIRLTGEFDREGVPTSLRLNIRTHKSFSKSQGRIREAYDYEEGYAEIMIGEVGSFNFHFPEEKGTDPRMIWFIEDKGEEKPSVEFIEQVKVEEKDSGYITLKGLRSTAKEEGEEACGAYLILNNTNMDKGEDVSQMCISVATPEIPTGEITRIEFGKDFMGDDFIGVEGIDDSIKSKLEQQEGESSGQVVVPSDSYYIYAWWEGEAFNNSVVGTYYRNYQYKDHYGNESEVAKRTIKVLPPGTATEDVKIPVSEGEGKLEGAVSMDAGDGNMSVIVSFPEDLTITGGSDWDGVLQVPTVVRTPVQPSPSSGMRTENVYSIEVGGNTPLLFDKPVKITFTGKAGHLVGWSRDGVFTPVTNICNPADGSGLGEGGADCKIDSGRDLVVWTRHMTVYTTYTESSIPRIGYRPPVESITTITPIVETAPEGQVLGAEKYNFTLLLKTGSRGTEVEELQKFLNDLGFDCGKVDGIFGKNTFAGVIAYQLSNKLKVDGIVGPETRGFLNK